MYLFYYKTIHFLILFFPAVMKELFKHVWHWISGLKGQSRRRLITMNEVKQHQMEGSMWTVLKGRVYNLSPYLKFHPGGKGISCIHSAHCFI